MNNINAKINNEYFNNQKGFVWNLFEKDKFYLINNTKPWFTDKSINNKYIKKTHPNKKYKYNRSELLKRISYQKRDNNSIYIIIAIIILVLLIYSNNS